jgi:type II restriction/modification system DNA methylase subunit YeeA
MYKDKEVKNVKNFFVNVWRKSIFDIYVLTHLRELSCEFEDVFATSEFDLGKFNAIQHGIDTESNRPVKQRIRRTPLRFAEEETQLKKMLMNAVLEQSSGLIFTCQYAELASSLEYHTFLAKVSRHSSRSGRSTEGNLMQSSMELIREAVAQ